MPLLLLLPRENGCEFAPLLPLILNGWGIFMLLLLLLLLPLGLLPPRVNG